MSDQFLIRQQGGLLLISLTNQRVCQGCCTCAGTYQLSIKDARTKEVLPGSPFTVAMEASVPVASHSSARFGAGVDKASVAVAGQAITVSVSLNDKFGNSTEGAHAMYWHAPSLHKVATYG